MQPNAASQTERHGATEPPKKPVSNNQTNADKTLQWLTRALFLLLATAGFSWLSSVGAQGNDNTRRIALIEIQQVTPQMLVNMERRLLDTIAANYTPVWLRVLVERLEKKVDVITDRLDQLKDRIIRLEEQRK